MEILSSSPAKFFVCEKMTEHSFKILEITHEPVAFQLLEKFFKFSVAKKSLYEKVVEFLKEDFIGNRFLKQEVHTDIREILGLVKHSILLLPLVLRDNRNVGWGLEVSTILTCKFIWVLFS